MSGAGTPTPEPTATPASPDPSPNMRRKLTRKSWALLVFLSINVAAAVIALVVAGLADQVAALWAFFLAQPLYLQVPLLVWIIVPPSGLVWLWWRASTRTGTVIEQAEKKVQLAEQRRSLVEVADEQTEVLVEKISEASEQVTATFQEEIGKLVQQRAEEKQALVASSRIVALADMPRVASLVGREKQLEALLEKLRAGDTMGIFALEGIGGVGKTALAAVTVEQLAKDEASFPGGVAWMPCNDLKGETGLDALFLGVAQRLHLPQVIAQTDPAARRAALNGALRASQRMLLALDNLEPGLDAETALNTLAIREQTAVVLTARQEVAPHLLEAITVAPLDTDPSLDLFRERLRQAEPKRPEPNAAEQQMLAKIVAMLGGLPLAIELTAAYLGNKRPMLQQLVGDLQAAPLDAAALRDPKNGLHPCFDRSWKVLTTAQKHLFAGLSLLAGTSFPHQAAEVMGLVAGTGTLNKPRDERQAEDDLNALISYALVEPLEGGRLRLHPLLREYAAGRLKTLAVNERLGDAMVAFWVAFARTYPGYEGMNVLEAEAEGLMGALAWAHAHVRQREVVTLAQGLAHAWRVRGRRADTLNMYVWANEAAKALGDQKEELLTTHQLAATLADIGRLEEARAGFERALELALQLQDPAAEQDEVHELALLAQETGRLEEARAGFERALELALQLQDPAAERGEVHSLAVLAADQGRLEEARAGFERALELARQLQNPAAERAEVHGLAVLAAGQGRLEEARAGFERALELARQLQNPAAERAEVHGLAALAADQGRLEEARAGFERALELALQLQDPAAEQDEVHGLAVLAADQGRLEEARAGFERALALTRTLNDPAAEAVELCNFGFFLSRDGGEQDRGRQLIEASLDIGERLSNIYLVGKCHQFLAQLDEDEGDSQSALVHFREALRCLEQVFSPDAEEVRADMRRLDARTDPAQGRVSLTQTEAERAVQDATFLAEHFGLAPDDPQIPTIQRQMQQALQQARQPPNETLTPVAQALSAFLGIQSWEETQAVLEREQALLLTEQADQVLSAEIEQAQQSHDTKAAEYLRIHRLLRRARELGLAEAWAEFEAFRKTAQERQQAEAGQPRQRELTRDEVERAATDAAFAAALFELAHDDPQIPTIQQQLRELLAGGGDGS